MEKEGGCEEEREVRRRGRGGKTREWKRRGLRREEQRAVMDMERGRWGGAEGRKDEGEGKGREKWKR